MRIDIGQQIIFEWGGGGGGVISYFFVIVDIKSFLKQLFTKLLSTLSTEFWELFQRLEPKFWLNNAK